jgi:phosphoglycolate phosphatase
MASSVSWVRCSGVVQRRGARFLPRQRVSPLGRYDPVVFDLDGTLVDSAPVITKALRMACARLGVPVAADTELGVCVGPPLEVVLPQVFGKGVDVSALAAEYRALYQPMAEAETKPMEGAINMLVGLRDAGVKLAVATYKPISLAVSLLEVTGIAPLISLCGARRSNEDRRTKVQILSEVLTALTPHGSTPLYIGDHEEDRRAASALEMDFIEYVGPTTWSELSRAVLEPHLQRDDNCACHDAATGDNRREVESLEASEQGPREHENRKRL